MYRLIPVPAPPVIPGPARHGRPCPAVALAPRSPTTRRCQHDRGPRPRYRQASGWTATAVDACTEACAWVRGDVAPQMPVVALGPEHRGRRGPGELKPWAGRAHRTRLPRLGVRPRGDHPSSRRPGAGAPRHPPRPTPVSTTSAILRSSNSLVQEPLLVGLVPELIGGGVDAEQAAVAGPFEEDGGASGEVRGELEE